MNMGITYERKTAVCAAEDLGLVEVDEDAWVSKGAAASVAGDDVCVDPADGLFVDELDGCEGTGLERWESSLARISVCSMHFWLVVLM